MALQLDLMVPPEGIVPKPGLQQLADYIVSCLNHAFAIDDIAVDAQQDPVGGQARYEVAVGKLYSMIETSGPLLAEVENPLESIMFIFGSLNGSINLEFQSEMNKAMLMGQDPGYIRAYQDHVLAMSSQVMFDMVKQHLDVIQWTGVIETGDDNGTD